MGSIHYLKLLTDSALARPHVLLERAARHETAADAFLAMALSHDDHCGGDDWEAEPRRCRLCGLDWDQAFSDMAEQDRLAAKYTRMAENALREAVDKLAVTLHSLGGWPGPLPL